MCADVKPVWKPEDFDLDAAGKKFGVFIDNLKPPYDLFLRSFFDGSCLLGFTTDSEGNVTVVEAAFPREFGAYGTMIMETQEVWQPVLDEAYGSPVEFRCFTIEWPKKSHKFSDYLQITEAAELLGTTTNTLRNWEKAGKIKVYRNQLNRYRFYKREDLEEILNSIELV